MTKITKLTPEERAAVERVIAQNPNLRIADVANLATKELGREVTVATVNRIVFHQLMNPGKN